MFLQLPSDYFSGFKLCPRTIFLPRPNGTLIPLVWVNEPVSASSQSIDHVSNLDPHICVFAFFLAFSLLSSFSGTQELSVLPETRQASFPLGPLQLLVPMLDCLAAGYNFSSIHPGSCLSRGWLEILLTVSSQISHIVHMTSPCLNFTYCICCSPGVYVCVCVIVYIFTQ